LHVNLIFLEVCLSWNSITRVIHVFATLYKYFRALQSIWIYFEIQTIRIRTIDSSSVLHRFGFIYQILRIPIHFFSRPDNRNPSSRLGRSIRSLRFFPRTCRETVIWNNAQNDNELEWERVNDLTVRYRMSRILLYDHREKVLYISVLSEEELLRWKTPI